MRTSHEGDVLRPAPPRHRALPRQRVLRSRPLPPRAAPVAVVGALGVVLVSLLLLDRLGGGVVSLLVPLVVAVGAMVATATTDRAFLLVCLVVSTLPFGAVEVGPVQVVQLVAVVAVVGVLAVELARGDLTPVPWPIGLPLSAMVVSAALSTYGSPTPDTTFRLDVALVVGVLLVTVVHSVVSSPSRLRVLARLLVAAAAVIGALGVASVSGAEVSNAGAVVTGRATSIFEQPNELGLFCALLLPVAVALTLAERSARARILATVATVAVLGGLLASLSRGAWVGAVVGLVALWLLLPDRRRFVLPALTGLAVVGGMLVLLARLPAVAVLNQRLVSVFAGSVNPYDERPAIYEEARRQVTESPWTGNGAGSFPTVATRLAQDGNYLQAEHAHNLVLTTWTEYGAVGVLCLLALVLGLSSRLLAGGRAVRDRLDRAGPVLAGRLVAGTAAGLVAVLAHGLVDYPLRNPVTSTSVWIVVGLAAAAARVAVAVRGHDRASRGSDVRGLDEPEPVVAR